MDLTVYIKILVFRLLQKKKYLKTSKLPSLNKNSVLKSKKRLKFALFLEKTLKTGFFIFMKTHFHFRIIL